MGEFAAAWARDDGAGLQGMFALGVGLAGAEPAGGREVVMRRASQQLSATGEMEVATTDVGLRGNLAYQTGRWKPGAGEATHAGSHLFVWERRPGANWQMRSTLIQDDPSVDRAADRAAILELDRQWEDAVKRRDIGSIANLYAPCGQLMPPGMRAAVSRDAVHQAFTGVLSAPHATLTFGESPEIVFSQGGDMADEIGTYRCGFTSLQGPVVDEGKYLITWVKTPEGWKVAADIFNSNLPAQ